MKMWSMKVIILLLFCYACLSTGNEGVYFVSRNFFNVLHWDALKPAFPGEKIFYTVQSWNDSTQEYRIKKECQNITALSCDLTAETPSVHDVSYLARVHGNNRSCGSTRVRFSPIKDTVFSPPVVSTHSTVLSLHVNVTLPLGPKGVSIADSITSSKHGPSKTELVYILNITSPKWAAQVNQSTTGQFVISLKNNQTVYCGNISYKTHGVAWCRNESEKAPFCVTLLDDPLTLLPWLLVSAALVTAIITTLVVCMCNYARGGKGKSIPTTLATTSSTPTRVLQFPDRKLIISIPEICIENHQTVYATIRMTPNTPSVPSGGYSPQDNLCQVWHGGTGSSFGPGEHSPTTNPEDTSAQFSEIYSVVAVHEHNEDAQQTINDNRETSNPPMSSSGESWDKAAVSPRLTSHGLQPLPHPDPHESNPARPLLLQTVRDSDGQLLLPSLIFLLQNSTDDTVPPLNPERKPLLSDLIDSKTERPSLASLKSFDGSELSDSGCDDSTVTTPTQPYCNTHYSPSQPVAPYFLQGWKNTPSSDAVLEAGYKQNKHLSASTDSCEYGMTDYPRTWTGPKKEEEGEEDEDRGEEKTGQIVLGGWVVQIQE